MAPPLSLRFHVLHAYTAAALDLRNQCHVLQAVRELDIKLACACRIISIGWEH